MAFMALRSRRILPTISTLVNNHFAVASFARLPEPPLNSTTSPVVQFQSRLFRSSPISMLCSTSPVNEEKVEEKINPNDIIFAGCDYNHWLITIDFPKDPKPTAEEMVETYVQTCAKGLNISEEEAKKRIYACSTTTYKGFQAVMTEEESEQFRALPNVIFILPDSYIDHVKKEYGGDKYVNGTIIPRPPPPQQNRFQGRLIETWAEAEMIEAIDLLVAMHNKIVGIILPKVACKILDLMLPRAWATMGQATLVSNR
ncbi:unnamed protein product [Rhodiola kirilowii]